MKRHLRPCVQKALLVIAFALLPIFMINDFNLKFMPLYLIGMAIEFTSIYLLAKYGKGLTDGGK